jgi:hypothetical protein
MTDCSKPTLDTFDMLFELLKYIEDGSSEIIFYADEGGVWQMGVEWNKVFPAYLKCLAAHTDPVDYAHRSTSLIEDYGGWQIEKFFEIAKGCASPEQKNALVELI